MGSDDPEDERSFSNAAGAETFLRAFEVNGSVERFLALDVLAMRVVIASAAFDRLRYATDWTRCADWTVFNEEQWNRGFDAVEDYEILRDVLFVTLREEPIFSAAHEMIFRAFPMTPLSFALAFDAITDEYPEPKLDSERPVALLMSWSNELKPERSAFESELKQLGVQIGVESFSVVTNAFLVADNPGGRVLGNVFDVVREIWQRRLTAFRSVEKSSSGQAQSNVKKPESRSGRKPNRLTYEIAAGIWQIMVEENAEARNSKPPTDIELRERFLAKGYPIAERTFQYMKSRWIGAGLRWPPNLEDVDYSESL